ncbi:hypothetical protein CMK19_01315 [Candidatus Poribacteria bacterium]|nr:hypothetical protein [Candidatus Poribacteria bacterium]
MKLFVPIKENSNRVPNKNFRDFGGVPLYVHTLSRLKGFEVYVDTDSKKILDEIERNPCLRHVKGYERNPDLLGDDVSVCKLISDFIVQHLISGPICQVHVTSPFIQPKTLRSAADMLDLYDSVASCDVIQERLLKKQKGIMKPVNHDPAILLPTQDLEKLYRENSLFYIFDADKFMTSGKRIGSNPCFYETSFPESLDIDYEDDWNTCVGVYKAGLGGL